MAVEATSSVRPVLSPDGWIFKAGTNEFSDTAPSDGWSPPPRERRTAAAGGEGGTDTTFRSPPSRALAAILRCDCGRGQRRKGQNVVIHLGYRSNISSRFGEFGFFLFALLIFLRENLLSCARPRRAFRALILTDGRRGWCRRRGGSET